MAAKLRLTLACGDYEIVRALKEGRVRPEGIELELRTDMDSGTRHAAMIRERAFDVSELSLSSYLMAKARGAALTAIPVFLHRRFRHGFVFINARKGIHHPADLIGRRIGVQSFQATANVWLRGILEHEYGVPHRALHWVVGGEEAVGFTPPAELTWMHVAPAKSMPAMLAEGELDAMLDPDVIAPIARKDPRVRRLFEDYKTREMEYFRRTGLFPIMHVTAIKQELVQQHPWLAASLMRAFESAKALAYERLRNPRIVPLAWFLPALEEQRDVLGEDPWAYGLSGANVKNLHTLIDYAHEQGLVDRRLALTELFIAPDDPDPPR